MTLRLGAFLGFDRLFTSLRLGLFYSHQRFFSTRLRFFDADGKKVQRMQFFDRLVRRTGVDGAVNHLRGFALGAINVFGHR